MELLEFNSSYLTNLLEILASEIKLVVLLGDFNADLPKYDQNSIISGFLNSMHFSFFLPYVFSPTCFVATEYMSIYPLNYFSKK